VAAPDAKATALDALAIQLAAAAPDRARPGGVRHRFIAVVIVIKPPAGATVEHVLEVGRRTPAGCPARANDLSLLLPRPCATASPVLAR